VVGEGLEYIMCFGLSDTHKPERVEFGLNTIRGELHGRLQNEKYLSQLDEASRVQLSLLPHRLPSFEGYDLAARMLPAEDVGGDFYDFIPVDEFALGVAVGDASGHGLGAALQVRDVVTGLRMGITSHFKISRTLRNLNKVIHRSSLSTRFVSLFYCEFDKQGHVFYVNAGHPTPYKVSPQGLVESLPTRGLVLGPMPDRRYERGYIALAKGEFLVMLTDGILERNDLQEQEFGTVALPKLLVDHSWKTAQDALESVWDAAYEHGDGAPWTDDATVVVVRREP
jgi:sigma-B regulation protein RsbU (phosphoserine phosphatase)